MKVLPDVSMLVVALPIVDILELLVLVGVLAVDQPVLIVVLVFVVFASTLFVVAPSVEV